MVSPQTVSKTPRRVPPIVLDARSIAGGKSASPAPQPRVRVLGAVAPQHRLLRGPMPHAHRRSVPDVEPAVETGLRFVSHMEVLDALLASAHERLLNRLSRLGMRRGQAQRFVVAATGRLLRAAQRLGDLADGRLAANAIESVPLRELAARTKVSEEQAEHGLQVVLAELTTVLVGIRG